MSKIKEIQKKACIKLSKTEEAYYESTFVDILNYIEAITSVGMPENTPVYTHQHIPKKLREDILKPSSVIESILNQAPQREENYFKVPPVLGGK